MLELKLNVKEVEVEKSEGSNIIYTEYRHKSKSKYKGLAKLIWKLLHKNPGCNLWINTDVYMRKNNRWVYFMSFDDKLFPQSGFYFCKKNFATRKRVQEYVRRLRKCQERLLKTEEVPERLGITGDIRVSFSD